MSYKEKLANRKELFSLKSYLATKARKRAEKLQFRADKKNHTHTHEHTHEHTEDVVEIEEDSLVKAD
jgi:hypothetical protein